MKTKNVKVLLSVAIAVLMAWAFASCKKSSDNPAPVVVSTTALQTAIDTANHYLTVAVEGTAAGDYTVGSKAILQTATTTATTVLNTTTGQTQSGVDVATTNLNTAIAAFKSNRIAPIDPADLIAYYHFDDGSGTTVADASTGKHNGTLTVSTPTIGSGTPNWVADRAGVANKALHFTDGGHVEVPASQDFLPGSITITVWVNLDSSNTSTGIYSDNYIVSQDDYMTYKFQTQSVAKPFFTVASTTAAGTYLNRDTNNAEDGPAGSRPTLYLKRWYHLAVTFTNGAMNFYVNGVLFKAWTDTPGAILPNATPDLFCIGVASSNAFFTANPPVGYTPPHFLGSMDELRMYKTALSAAQIASIYAQEKP
jgi:hypothetical protein